MNGIARILRERLHKDFGSLYKIHKAHPLRTWLALAAFIVAFTYALSYQIAPTVDARKFHTIAVNLVTKGTFCFGCDVPLAKDTAIRDIGPGYQFFLAGVYKIFGIRIWMVWLLQALMHATIVWWLYGLIRRILGQASSNHLNTTLPLALYAFHPDIIQAAAMLMSEALFVFLLMILVKIFISIWERHGKSSWTSLIGMGLLSGALMMVRPTGLPFLIIVLFVFAWKHWWKAGLIVLMGAVLIQAPWAIRNARLYNHFVLNSVVGGLDIWVGLDPYSPGEFNMDALPHITSKINGLDSDEIDRVSLAEAKKIVQEKPLFAIGRTMHKGLKLFALTKTSAFWFHYRSTVDQLATLVLSLGFNAIIWLAAFACLIEVIWRSKWPPILISLAIFCVILLAVSPTLTVVVNRYRIPMLPFAILLMSYWFIITKSWRERGRSLIVAVLIIILCTVADLWNSFPKVLDRIRRIRGAS